MNYNSSCFFCGQAQELTGYWAPLKILVPFMMPASVVIAFFCAVLLLAGRDYQLLGCSIPMYTKQDSKHLPMKENDSYF